MLRRFALTTTIACLCLVPGTRRTHAQPARFDLGTLGGDVSFSQRINAMGQVVGWSSIAGNSANHAFLWTPDVPNGTTGSIIDLGHLGASYSIAYGINDVGVVVGASATSGGEQHAFVWTQATGMVDLGTLGGVYSFALGINDGGFIPPA